MIPTIRQHPKEPIRIFSLMRWGLIPYWAKDPSIGLKTINAMSETAAAKPVFRDAFKYRRCLIPAEGFYEVKKSVRSKSRLIILERSRVPFLPLLACGTVGVSHNTMLETCAILTAAANSLVAEVHDRMPAILSEEGYDRWLDP